MLTDNDLDFIFKGTPGTPVVWVIDGECLYDLALTPENAQIFFDATEVVDISADYPDHDGITVRLLKDGIILMELSTSEYFGSILLSNPQVLNLRSYPYGKYVESPNATFDGEKFNITNRDMTTLQNTW
jgi:hypothetical protein